MGCECVTSHGHGELVMEKIRDLWKDQMLSDYTLIAEGRIFKVHKIVLASLSEYFQAAFRSGMLEGVTDSQELKGLTASSLGLILHYFYTGELPLCPDTVGDVLGTAVFLQCEVVIHRCCKYLDKNLSMDNYSDIKTLADMYHIHDLFKILYDYRLKHFTKFAKTDHFLEMTSAEVIKLIKDDKLKCSAEYKVFKLVMRWIKHNQYREVASILQYVRFPQMTEEELGQVGRAVTGDPACVAYVDEALQYRASAQEQVLCDFPRCVLRSQEYIVTFGCTDVAMHSCVLYKGEWRTLDGALGQPRPFVGASAVVVNNHLFVCGGHVGGNSAPSRACYCFRPADRKWVRLESMSTHRRNFAMVPDGRGGLLVFGGVTTDDHVTRTVERYSIRDGVWSEEPRMARELADLAGCLADDKVFLAGGVDENCLHSSEFRTFDPQTAAWSRLPDILRIKFRPKMFAVGPNLFLADVYRTDGGSAQLERYSITANQWSIISLPRVQFSRIFGAAVTGKWLYFVGKNNLDDGSSKRVNLSTGAVTNTSSYPYSVDGPLCCVLKLPQKFIKEKMLSSNE